MEVKFRQGVVEDAEKVWQLVQDTPALDDNSLYFYLVMFSYFSKYSAVAFENGRLAGFVCGFAPPENPDTYFCWQICVAEEYKGLGIAKKLLKTVMGDRYQSLQATVTPSNISSRALFGSYAKTNDQSIREKTLYDKNCFKKINHEEEILLQIR